MTHDLPTLLVHANVFITAARDQDADSLCLFDAYPSRLATIAEVRSELRFKFRDASRVTTLVTARPGQQLRCWLTELRVTGHGLSAVDEALIATASATGLLVVTYDHLILDLSGAKPDGRFITAVRPGEALRRLRSFHHGFARMEVTT